MSGEGVQWAQSRIQSQHYLAPWATLTLGIDPEHCQWLGNNNKIWGASWWLRGTCLACKGHVWSPSTICPLFQHYQERTWWPPALLGLSTTSLGFSTELSYPVGPRIARSGPRSPWSLFGKSTPTTTKNSLKNKVVQNGWMNIKLSEENIGKNIYELRLVMF